MGFFGESKHQAETGEHGGQDGDATDGAQRFAQGFELLFGGYFRQVELRLERLEAEAGDRLNSLEKNFLRHTEELDELADKCRASVERSDGEHRSRKSAESELRQGIARVQTALDAAIDDFRARTGELARGGDHQEAIEALSRRLEAFESSQTDRGELAALLVRASQALAPDSA